jgi:ABC-2 type transport system permease protein
MRKYLAVFAIDWQNQFIYRLNFILWRFRNVLRLLLTYFLWSGIFVSSSSVFGYSEPQIFAYVFLVLIVHAIVLSAPSSDNIGGEIGSGDLSNYLVKPISYLKFWFVRDLSSKLLNFLFAAGEILLLYLWLRPDILISPSAFQVSPFLFMLLLSVPLYYFINISARFVSFWTPENTWGLSFLIIVLYEVLGGIIFPLDVLPPLVQTAVQFTPFPYLVYYPVVILLGKITGWELVRIYFQTGLWTVVMFLVAGRMWRRGLTVYSSEGR